MPEQKTAILYGQYHLRGTAIFAQHTVIYEYIKSAQMLRACIISLEVPRNINQLVVRQLPPDLHFQGLNLLIFA